MNIIVTGLNYKTASVQIRERFAFNKKMLLRAIQTLQSRNGIQECVIVGTCNRTEIYSVVDQINTGRNSIIAFLAKWFNTEESELENIIYVKENDEAIRHLFRVTCGLDSLVIGETQILGQVKDAFIQSLQLKATDKIFNRLFKQSITLAKYVHTNTEIGQQPVSVSYAAVELGKKILNNISDKTVVILGAGKISELTAKHLYSNGVEKILVVNRTYGHAMELAERFNGVALGLDQISSALIDADIVISSIDTAGHIIKKQQIQAIIEERKQPLFMIDIAVPRNIDPEIGFMDNVFLYDIDDLESIVKVNLQDRAREARKIEVFIKKEVETFKMWLDTLEVIPLISRVRKRSMMIQEEVVFQIENKLPNLTEHDLKVIRKYSKSIVNQILHEPLINMKHLVVDNLNKTEMLDIFTQLFSLENERENQSHEPSVTNLEITLNKTPV
ncbi:glutamyl-tRNA reductase [Bacillus sp. EB600]|uniref:glutamyl-tRNA reductase n=1 Tax=Bacillus sp. EB600 TaxID=2806345 RepID=UPI00210B5731|nr:glutamyl-tRNA reductase [Bacillus sp. EB600]MCQ6281208.1 glutamyl-tRNA reductase [Bacillus sp. EB600]